MMINCQCGYTIKAHIVFSSFEFNNNSTPLRKVQLFCQTIRNVKITKSFNCSTLLHIAKRYQTLYLELITRRSQVRVLSPQPESPDFSRNQDFFRTFASNNLLAIFSDPNADPNGRYASLVPGSTL